MMRVSIDSELLVRLDQWCLTLGLKRSQIVSAMIRHLCQRVEYLTHQGVPVAEALEQVLRDKRYWAIFARKITSKAGKRVA